MNIRFTKRMLIQIAVISGVFFFSTFRAEAISVSPPRIEIKGNPGETIQQEMTLTNDTDANQIFYSSFANFEAQGESGNPSFVESKEDLDKWISVQESVALPPGGSVIVPVLINIPQNATPGGHFAAIFWGTNPTGTGASAVSIGAKVGMLILLSVSGDVKEAGGLISFDTLDNKVFYNTLPVSFTYRFKNDGGDRIKPVGKIRMHDLLYIPEDSIDANPTNGNILPNSTRRFDIDWVKNPRSNDFISPDNKIEKFFSDALYQWQNYAFGPYFAKLSLEYGTNSIHTSKYAFFFVFPWQLLICLLVIFIVIFFGGKRLIKRYNRYIIQKAHDSLNVSVNKSSNVQE